MQTELLFDDMVVYAMITCMEKDGHPMQNGGWCAPWMTDNRTLESIRRLLKDGWIIEKNGTLHDAQEVAQTTFEELTK